MEPPLIGLRTAASALAGLFSLRQPRLAAHLTSEGVGAEHLCLSWMQTLFSNCTPLPRATLCRIWECWLLDGSPKVFFRVALALFAQAETALLGEPVEVISEVLRNFPAPLDAGLAVRELIPRAWATKITNSKLWPALAAAEASVRASSPPPGSPGSSGSGGGLVLTPQSRQSEPELVMDLRPHPGSYSPEVEEELL
mmetsp:Transcript_59666/g.194647  ORF Transcript_59666/g.194647 Transcript_59666/m.194647 type:complete len:197 (-) Transcript_59666:91-681(-)